MEMDRTITQAFFQTNLSVKLIGTADASTMLNRENLADEYAGFLGGFETSGMPNTVFLNKLGESGQIDHLIPEQIDHL
jgi:hypothetical protein